MTTDTKSTLLGSATREALESSAALSNMFPSDRTAYPLAEFEGTFTGKEGVYNDVNQTTGQIWAKPTLIIEDVKVIRKIDATAQIGNTYDIVVDEPNADKFEQSRIGMMLQAAIESGAVKDWLGELNGKRCHFTITAKQPWPGAQSRSGKALWNFYYKVKVVGEAEANTPAATIDPAALKAAIEFANGLTPDEFRARAISELSSKGIQDEELFAAIALGQFPEIAGMQVTDGVMGTVG